MKQTYWYVWLWRIAAFRSGPYSDGLSLPLLLEVPYKPLLDAGVKFYAFLGNHDDQKCAANCVLIT
jgi:hypothetical protein